MSRKSLTGLGAAAICIGAVLPQTALAAGNPLAKPSTLPYEAPPFDKIKDADYQQALEDGMRQQRREIDAIVKSAAKPSFENTILALEKSGRLLDRASLAFFGVATANTNDTLDKIQTVEAPKLSEHQDAINLNAKLFARVKAVYDARDTLDLDPESRQLLQVYYDQFVRAGANLSDADKVKLKALNKEDASLSTDFRLKLVAAAKAGALVVDDKAKLSGLTDGEIAAAAQAAQARGLKGKYVIPLQNTTQQPLLASLADRDTRQKLFENAWTRAEKGDQNDTRAVIARLAELRAEKAKLLGFKNYAAYVLGDQMAKTPEAVNEFIQKMVPAIGARSIEEAKEIQAAIDSSGPHFDLKPWDWTRYSEMVRKQKYDLDQNELKPYFELNRVLQDGLFYAATQLYGITLKERRDIPIYQADVRVFEVLDKDGSTIGLIYFDFFKRDNKNGGAWTSNWVNQSKFLGTKPVAYNVCNFTKPAPGEPALLTADDVITMFHEFGHGLHALFSDLKYETLSGTSVARDFVEFPSQFNEHWALYPDVLKHYAIHYKTGAPMPLAMIDRIKAAKSWNQGYEIGELLSASELDMEWHEIAAGTPKQDADQFETKALAGTHTDFANVPPRYRSSYFLHIWANGYSAGYYAYQWSKMLDDDSYAWFIAHGGLTRENGQRFRDLILSRGHFEDYGTMFRAFYGKDPDIGPMLEERGIAKAGN